CERFYRTWYAPNNVVLAIAGRFDERSLLAQIADSYGAMKKSRLPREASQVEPAQRRERRKTLSLDTAAEKILLGYRAPAISDPDWAVLTVLGQHLIASPSSRLHQELVMERELATGVWGYLPPFAHPSLYEMGIDLRAGISAGKALRVVDREIDRVAKRGIDERSLNQAKARIELGLISSMETAGGKADLIGFAATLGLPLDHVFQRIDATRAVRADDLKDVARRLLRPSQRTVITVVPR
ncbi:MAG: insulinase family protein, partial [Myxococcota bacterium]